MRLQVVAAFLFVFNSAAPQAPKLTIPIGHKSGVSAVALSPDGKLMASAGTDQRLNVWDTRHGQLLRSTNFQSPLSDVVFSRNGVDILTATSSGIVVSETRTGNEVSKLAIAAPSKIWPAADDQHIIVMSPGGIAVWNFKVGKLVRQFENPGTTTTDGIFNYFFQSFVQPIPISANGRLLALISAPKSILVWDIASGKMIAQHENRLAVNSLSFSADAREINFIDEQGILFKWNVTTGVVSDLARLELEQTSRHEFAFVPGLGSVLNRSVKPQSPGISELSVISPEKPKDRLLQMHDLDSIKNVYLLSRQFVIQYDDNSLELFDPIRNTRQFFRGTDKLMTARLTSNGRSLAIGFGRELQLLNLQTGRPEKVIQSGGGEITALAFSDDGRHFAHGSYQGKIVIRRSSDNQIVAEQLNTRSIRNLQFDRNGKILFFASRGIPGKEDDLGTIVIPPGDKETSLRALRAQSFSLFGDDSILTCTGNELRVQRLTGAVGRKKNISASFNISMPPVGAFSQDGALAAVLFPMDSLLIWNLNTNSIQRLPAHDTLYRSRDGSSWVNDNGDYFYAGDSIHAFMGNLATSQFISISPEKRFVFYPTLAQKSILFDLSKHRPTYFDGLVQAVDWAEGTAFLINDNQVNLINFKTGEHLLSWTPLGGSDFVVTHKSGLFDASRGALSKLYFVQGLDFVDLNQLKARYFEPGLWKKAISGEKLRNVVGFNSIELPPDVQLGNLDADGFLPIRLVNRGGGIGQVSVLLNGKEIIADARESSSNSGLHELELNVFIGKHKGIIKGQENLVAVKAWNEKHWVESRSEIKSFRSSELEQYRPKAHILTCGISDYTGVEIDLKFAAKDASSIGTALQLGAKGLFGENRTFLYSLTTGQSQGLLPTKANIIRTLNEISSKAHPLDVFVLYLSGHGINQGGADGDWYYLTQEAFSADPSTYNDPDIRLQSTISSNELVELFKGVPALKQVLVLDACASGRVTDNLMVQKDIESSTLRALDRMRDRTGIHIITGCAADAVSYEASKYGQGVLTYSLLEGIRGAALRDEEFVDVNQLFQYAQDRVPALAVGIGGIQTPQIFSPVGSQSFDIGLLRAAEKAQIPISNIRPVYVRSNFQDELELEDVIGLGKSIDQALNEASGKGGEASVIFVDVREYPDGCKLSGSYRQKRGVINLKMKKRCSTDVQTFELKARTIEELRTQIMKRVSTSP